MTRNEYTEITTMAQLRAARKSLSDRITSYEEQFSARLDGLRTALSMKHIAIKSIRKIREAILAHPLQNPKSRLV